MSAGLKVREVARSNIEDDVDHDTGGVVVVRVGESLDDMGDRVIDAVRRAEAGEVVRERHLGFESWEGLVRMLSPKRLELLRHLQVSPARNIRALSLALGRGYHRTHEDVTALEGVGLVERDKDGVRTTYAALDVRATVLLF